MAYFSHLRIVINNPNKIPHFGAFIFYWGIMCHKSIARSLNDNHEPPRHLKDFYCFLDNTQLFSDQYKLYSSSAEMVYRKLTLLITFLWN